MDLSSKGPSELDNLGSGDEVWKGELQESGDSVHLSDLKHFFRRAHTSSLARYP